MKKFKKDDSVLPVNEHIKLLLEGEAHDHPCDDCEISELDVQLPPWFDSKKFKIGQNVMIENIFGQFILMFSGLICVLAVPNILQILMNSHRSSTTVTAYRRYVSTIKHIVSWINQPLEPGTMSWKSLTTVRARHLRASKVSQKQSRGHISQLDLVLTQFAFFGCGVLRPGQLGFIIKNDQDMIGYIHFWRVIGYMLGIEDRFNLCRTSLDETKQVCNAVCTEIYHPLLYNPPEYFYHMTHTLLEGMWYFSPTLPKRVTLYFTYRLMNIRGFDYTEKEKVEAAIKEKEETKKNGKVELSQIMNNNNIPNMTSSKNSSTELDGVKYIEKLDWWDKTMLHFQIVVLANMKKEMWRWYFNGQIHMTLFLVEYFPFLCFWRFGWRNSFIDMFTEDLKVQAPPKTNLEMLSTNCF